MPTSLRCLLTILCLLALPPVARAQTSAFTYQGHLTDHGIPANGRYDFSFRLAADAQGNSYISQAILLAGQPVTNGQFVATLDYGSWPFTGQNLWLQVGVRTNGTNGAYTYLSPLSPLNPAPYAIAAYTATEAEFSDLLIGPVPTSQLTGTLQPAQFAGYTNAVSFTNAANSFGGDGAGLTNISASGINGFWTNSYTNILVGVVAGVSRHPALGYNTWFLHGDSIDETNMLIEATNMLKNGMFAAGYRYFNLDEGWEGSVRDSNGFPTWSTNFPMGPTNWFNKLHSMGLLGGLYGPGQNTLGYAGSHLVFSNYYTDGRAMGLWGADYVKNDGGWDRLTSEEFLRGFLSTGRVPYYNAPENSPYGQPLQSWMVNELSSCRVAQGPAPSDAIITDLLPFHWDYFTNRVAVLALPKWANQSGYAHCHWNDPDAFAANMFTKQEMSLFSMLQCQLLVAEIPPPGSPPLYYLTNTEVLAIDQDDLAIPGNVVSTSPDGFGQVWAKPVGNLNSGVKAVCLFNQNTNASVTLTCNWSDIGLPPGPALLRDLWYHSFLGYYTNSYTVTLVPGDVQLLTVQAGMVPFLHTGTNYLSDLWPMPGWTNMGGAISSPLGALTFPGINQPTLYPGSPYTAVAAINGINFTNNLQVDGPTSLSYCLARQATRFHSAVGPNSTAGAQWINVFQVWLDGVLLADSGEVRPGDPPHIFDLNVTGGNILTLVTTNYALTGPVHGVNVGALWGNAGFYVPDQNAALSGVTEFQDVLGRDRVLLKTGGTYLSDENGANSLTDTGTSLQLSTATKPVIISGDLVVNGNQTIMGNQTNFGAFTVINSNLVVLHYLGSTNSGYPVVSALGPGLGTGQTSAFVTNDVAVTDNDFNVVLAFSGSVPSNTPVVAIQFAQPWPNNVKPNCFLTWANAQAVSDTGKRELFVDPAQTTTNQIVIMSGATPPTTGVAEVSCHCRGSN